MAKKKIKYNGDLVDYIMKCNSTKYKNYHNSRTCYEAYVELKKNLKPVHDNVELGTMADCFKEAKAKLIESIKTVMENDLLSDEEKNHRINMLLLEDSTIFLNKHGVEHIDKVIQKASEIVSCFFAEQLSEFEAFLLLCSIEIHDIGNIFGRAGHEKRLIAIFEEHSKDIILDSAERRLIKNIAMAHGGKATDGTKDTISPLMITEKMIETDVRTRLLAAILRFADEIADDVSRAKKEPLELGIVGLNSKIFHDYSLALHTVCLEKKPDNSYSVNLVYELEAVKITENYSQNNTEHYLLDEIYNRTLKMERERRYCSKFWNSYLNIHRIEVEINVYDDECRRIDKISYTLEDTSYPDEPTNNSIKDIVENIRTGKEEIEYLHLGDINGDNNE